MLLSAALWQQPRSRRSFASVQLAVACPAPNAGGGLATVSTPILLALILCRVW